MRIRLFLAVTSIGLFGAGFAIQACGSTTNDAVTTADAAPEATAVDSSVKDTSVPDAKDAAPPCDPNVDILVGIMDASIADGASSVGLCLGCAKTKCSMEIDACKKDCDCQGIAGGALECFAKSQSIACAGPFASASMTTRNIGIALAGCVQQSCPDECQTKQFMDAGADADAEAGM
jgi:hypothetical protein